LSCFGDEAPDWLEGCVPRSEAVGAVGLGAVVLLGAGSVVADPAGLFRVERRVAAEELFVSMTLARGRFTILLLVSVEVAVSDWVVELLPRPMSSVLLQPAANNAMQVAINAYSFIAWRNIVFVLISSNSLASSETFPKTFRHLFQNHNPTILLIEGSGDSARNLPGLPSNLCARGTAFQI